MIKLHLGCGDKIYSDFINCDNSTSLKLSKFISAAKLLYFLGIINNDQLRFIKFCKKNDIQYCDVTKKLPYNDMSVDVIYTSHVLEHLSSDQCDFFLAEAFRVLKPGGTLRTCLPDLEYHILSYLEHKDADRFVNEIMMAKPLKSIASKISVIFLGHRHHQWMYDAESFIKKVSAIGFEHVYKVETGLTKNTGFNSLDLAERHEISFYVEATKS